MAYTLTGIMPIDIFPDEMTCIYDGYGSDQQMKDAEREESLSR